MAFGGYVLHLALSATIPTLMKEVDVPLKAAAQEVALQLKQPLKDAANEAAVKGGQWVAASIGGSTLIVCCFVAVLSRGR